jgi:hypothetical protein
MGVDISQGGGGGGITIETDPTALKLTGGTLTGTLLVQAAGSSAFAQIVPDIDYPSINISDSGGNWMQYSSSGITFPDGSTQTTAAGGGGGGGTSFGVTGFSEWNVENYADLSTTGPYAGSIGTGNYLGDSVNIVCETQTVDSYRKVGLIGTTTINEGTYNASFMFGWHQFALEGSGQYGWKVDPCLIFPDGTVQYTAYTGGGGGGGSITNEQRLADAIAGSFGYIQYYLFDVGYGFSIGWTWAGSSTGYTYPSVVDRANWYGCGISVNGNLYPLQYADTYGFYTVENLTSGYQSGEFFVYVNNAISEPQLSMPFGSNV